MQPSRSQFGLDPPAPDSRALPPLGTFIGLLALLAVALFLARSLADTAPLPEPVGKLPSPTRADNSKRSCEATALLDAGASRGSLPRSRCPATACLSGARRVAFHRLSHSR
jgi:hypothetical protein